MPRLFTGIEIPPRHREALAALQIGPAGMRWIEPSDFHVTLRFIGDVSPRMGTDIIEALAAKTWKAPQIKLGELAHFGGRKPTSVYCRVQENDTLSALAASHERLMQQLGLPPDGRRFTPHVTLGRCRGLASEEIARWLGATGGFMAPAFTPTRFVLYSAKDSVGGGPYRVEERFDFE